MHIPHFTALSNHKLSSDVHAEFIYGTSGWLRVAIAMFLFAALYHLMFTLADIDLWPSRLTNLKLKFLLLRIVLDLFTIAGPVYISYMLSVQKENSLFTAKMYLVFYPFAIFVWNYFFGLPIARLHDAISATFFLPALTISTPGLLYLFLSNRVRNTYLFFESTFPSRIECPFCLSTLDLDKNERKNMNATCPECGHTISWASCAG